jgi:uncharacterized membrane protein YbhN (UPF0104 family)
MSGTYAAAEPETEPRRFRGRRLLLILGSVLAIGAIASLLGWDIRGWFSELWDTVTGIDTEYLVAGAFFQTLQTLLKAVAWYWILRYAYPQSELSRLQVLAAYAASVGLNGFLPANLGTFAMLIMFLTIVAGSTFPGVVTAYLVQKIFFTVIGAVVYLYLFLTVSGSFDIELGWVHDHPWASAVIVVGGAVLTVMVVRILMAKAREFMRKAKAGAEILRRPRAYFLRVFVPQLLGWSAGLAVIGVFLAAYDIPVTFHTVMSVVGGNSLANVTAVTPGSVGITQAVNVASLNDVTTAANATAYSIGQQLFTTAWNILVAIVLLVWAFGWSGGKQLVTESYSGAKQKAAEQSAARKERRDAKSKEGGVQGRA